MISYGDIIGVQGDGWLSDEIRKATGNGPLSHIAIVTADSPFVQVTEALGQGIVVTAWPKRLDSAQHLWVLKSPLSPDDRKDACFAALSHVGEPYGWDNLAWQLMDDLSRSRWFTEHFVKLKHDKICSELAAICEAKLGLRAESASPNDFWGFWQVEKWPVEQIK